MTPRIEELDQIDRLDATELWDAIAERRPGPPPGPPVSPLRRASIIVVSLAIGAAAIAVPVAAFRGSNSPPPAAAAPDLAQYVNPMGIPITVSYPSDWYAASFSQPRQSSTDTVGLVISTSREALPAEDPSAPSPGPIPEDASLPPDFVLIYISTRDLSPQADAPPDTPLPISWDDAKPFPGPADIASVAIWVGGKHVEITVQFGDRSPEQLFAVESLLASIRPTTAQPSGDPAAAVARILVAIDSPRITSMDIVGTTIKITGRASTDYGDVARTLWYESVAGAALAQLNNADRVDMLVLDASGNELDSVTDEPSDSGAQIDPLADITMSPSDVAAVTAKLDPALGLTVTGAHYVGLFGGGAEVVVQPDDVEGFVAHASTKLGKLLGPLTGDNRPYLVTVVDATGAPQLILGHMPGMGGTLGEGMGWVAPGMQTDAIIGQPVTIGSTQPSP